jgi:hypothetical protein
MKGLNNRAGCCQATDAEASFERKALLVGNAAMILFKSSCKQRASYLAVNVEPWKSTVNSLNLVFVNTNTGSFAHHAFFT